MATAAYVLAVSVAILWLLSVVVSYLKAADAVALPPVGKVGILSSVLTAVLSMLVVLSVGSVSLSYLKFAPDYESDRVTGGVASDGSGSRSSGVIYRSFHEFVRYGGEWVSEDALEPLPKGEAFLTGRIRYQNSPAEGVSLRLVVDSRYHSEPLTTDQDGVFSVAVPAGEWTLNRITMDRWPGRPANKSVTVTGGPNPPLGDSMYYEGPSFSAPGVLLEATASPSPLRDLDLVIRPGVSVLWPSEQEQNADWGEDRLSWDAYDSASRYQVQLHRVERDGSSTSYYPVAWVNTTATELPLSDIQRVRGGSGAENEYAVKVYAFDDEGELLSISADYYWGSSIMLSGEAVVETSELQRMEDLSGVTQDDLSERLEARRFDKRRLDAAELLVKEGLTDAARSLLEHVKSPASAEEKMAVSAMILAGEGRCDEALSLLDEAKKKHGRDCEPVYVTERCGTN